jgi:hypothetical protein
VTGPGGGKQALHPFWLSLAGGLLAALSAAAAEPAALQQIERKAPREPRYVARQPLYGLLAFGPAAQTRVWLVLDKSKPDADHYDVLYADLNGNGDLTESAERFVGQTEGGDVRFKLPDFKDPATGARHTQFSVRVSGTAEPTVMVSLHWRDHFKMGGGYPEDPEKGYLKLANRPAAAPVLWANGDGPFRFQRWYGDRLTIGGADDLKVFVGQQGVGASSFWAFQEHFLPESEGVQATLIYRDTAGKERQVVSPLKERC